EIESIEEGERFIEDLFCQLEKLAESGKRTVDLDNWKMEVKENKESGEWFLTVAGCEYPSMNDAKIAHCFDIIKIAYINYFMNWLNAVPHQRETLVKIYDCVAW
ncbi:hypothetical protein ADUPG1_005325, partial [Aduncisulcus paluster]